MLRLKELRNEPRNKLIVFNDLNKTYNLMLWAFTLFGLLVTFFKELTCKGRKGGTDPLNHSLDTVWTWFGHGLDMVWTWF